MHHSIRAVCGLALLTAACSTHVQTRDGTLYAGELVDGDRQHLVLIDGERTPPAPEHAEAPGEPFERVALLRDDVADVDHPGDGLMIAGGIVWLTGAVMVLGGLTADPEPTDEEPDDCAPVHGGPACPLLPGEGFIDGRDLQVAGGLVLGGIGATLAISGLVQYLGSSQAADVGLAVGPGAFALSGRF